MVRMTLLHVCMLYVGVSLYDDHRNQPWATINDHTVIIHLPQSSFLPNKKATLHYKFTVKIMQKLSTKNRWLPKNILI